VVKIILASTSPARRELLAACGIPFEVVAPRVEESTGADAVILAEELARAKALAVARSHPNDLIIGADQVLSCQGRLFGKPADRGAARAELEALSGAKHELITAVAVAVGGGIRAAHARATLEMRRLSGEEIERYLETGEWQGCAGAYRIEGRGILLFERVEGDFTGIRGLPMILLGAMLREAGVSLP
jgi:septum formation protein